VEFGLELRAGIGLHVGIAVIGSITTESQSLQFLGDIGNVAAKLEEQCKQFVCTLVASVEALKWVTSDTAGIDTAFVHIAGKQDAIEIAAFRDRGALERLMTAYQ
jgi:adenylate cyclase